VVQVKEKQNVDERAASHGRAGYTRGITLCIKTSYNILILYFQFNNKDKNFAKNLDCQNQAREYNKA
jgi:hypothetical protein